MITDPEHIHETEEDIMIDMSKAIITVDTSPETLKQVEWDMKFASATHEERREMADALQKEWNRKYLKGVLLPWEKETLGFRIKVWFRRMHYKMTHLGKN